MNRALPRRLTETPLPQSVGQEAGFITLCVCVAALAAIAPTAASAHSLSQNRAENGGTRDAIRFATGDDYWYIDCEGGRLSAHVRRCIIASYDVDADTTCDAYMRVKMSRRSYRTRTGSWTSIDCYEGDRYDLASTYGG